MFPIKKKLNISKPTGKSPSPHLKTSSVLYFQMDQNKQRGAAFHSLQILLGTQQPVQTATKSITQVLAKEAKITSQSHLTTAQCSKM